MMSVNTRCSVEKYKESLYIHIIENILIICILLGAFMTSDLLNVIRYVLSIFIQMSLIIYLIWQNKKIGCSIGGYLSIVSLIVLIAISFSVVGTDLSKTINRIGALIAVFGVVIIREKSIKIDTRRVVCGFVKWYVALVIVINLDVVCFLISGNAVWKPISYLGYRYTGPFGDPNFMALYSVSALLVLLSINTFTKRTRVFCVIVLCINIVLANSLSSYLVLFLTVVLNKIWKEKSVFKKQVILLLVYSICMVIYINYANEIETMGIFLLEKMYGNYNYAMVKYSSLVGRLDTQAAGIEIAMNELLGQGPLQIVPQLGRDTHNSYIGFFFEQGILGLVLIIISFKVKKRDNKLVNYVGTFLMLSAMLLNVHYTTIFSLCLLMQKMDSENDECIV